MLFSEAGAFVIKLMLCLVNDAPKQVLSSIMCDWVLFGSFASLGGVGCALFGISWWSSLVQKCQIESLFDI
jgi:hypothetical protein